MIFEVFKRLNFGSYCLLYHTVQESIKLFFPNSVCCIQTTEFVQFVFNWFLDVSIEQIQILCKF